MKYFMQKCLYEVQLKKHTMNGCYERRGVLYQKLTLAVAWFVTSAKEEKDIKVMVF